MPSPALLLDAARFRWAQVAAEHPEVGPALPLHQALLTLQLDLLGELQGEPPDPGALADAAAHAVAGRTPAFRAVAVPDELRDATPWMPRFAGVLAEGGAGPAARKIAAAVGSGQVDPLALLAASWHRDPDAVADLTAGLGLNLQVTWLVAELASAPFAHRWQAAWLEGSDGIREAVGAWGRGNCPACGAWPVLAEYFLGERLNRCAYCAAAWPLRGTGCTYCGEHGDDFRVVVANREHPGRRLELCRACGGYLKTIDVARSIPFPLLAIEDLASQDLDRAAQHHGFRRTPLERG